MGLAEEGGGGAVIINNNLNTNTNGGMMKRCWRGLSNLPVFVEIKEVREGILLFNIFKLFP